VSTHIISEPGDDSGEGGPGSHGDEGDGYIRDARRDVSIGEREQDDIAGCGYEDTYRDEDVTVAEAVAEDRCCESYESCEYADLDNGKLGMYGIWGKVVKDAEGERAGAVAGAHYAHVHENANLVVCRLGWNKCLRRAHPL